MSVSARKADHPDGEVVSMSTAEFRRARKAALESIGMSYSELKKQARTGRFSSARAKKVWIAIGGHTR